MEIDLNTSSIEELAKGIADELPLIEAFYADPQNEAKFQAWLSRNMSEHNHQSTQSVTNK